MIIFIISILVFAIVIYFIYQWIRLAPYNQAPLDIKTFDGSNSPYHPSVLYFKEGWNGYKYWMAETPYSPLCKPYQDRNECPSIHVSNDGITWKEITTNPIDNLNDKEVEELDYFSDPHLVYTNNRIECWYRLTHRKGNKNNHIHTLLLRRYSSDGISWSKREVLAEITENSNHTLGNAIFSPAIIYKDGLYRMYYVNSDSPQGLKISYSESIDAYKWDTPHNITLIGATRRPWHIDVNYIDGLYYLINYDMKDISVWNSNDGTTFCFQKQLLSPSVKASFYGSKLYRACIIKDDKGYKVFFSGNDFIHTYIGLLEGDNISNLKFAPIGYHLSFWGMILYYIRLRLFSFNYIINRIKEKRKAKNKKNG